MTTDQPGNTKGQPSGITLAFTVLTHILLLLPVIYILVLAFGSYSFFVWHPICMAVGVGLLITEAVFSISGEAFLSSKLPRRKRITVHWILHTVGIILLTIGFIIVVVNKVNHRKAHFVSNHANLGLSTFIFTFAAAAFGILANNTRWIYPQVRPVLVKIIHALGGICVTILLLATIINGTYTPWWMHCGGTDLGRSLVFASFFFVGLFILLKPILAAVSRSKVVCGTPSSDT